MTERRPPVWLRALFSAALRLHPRDRRGRYAAEARAAFDDGWRQRRARSSPAASAWALRAVADAALSGLSERRRAMGGRSGAFADLRGDVRIAARTLARTPAFTAAAVAVLALGIGANAAVFSAVRGTLLAPLPFPEADRLVLLDLTDSSTVRAGPARSVPWSYPKYRVLVDAPGRPIDPVAAFASRTLTLTGAGDAARVRAEVVSPGYLELLGARPAVGRALATTDDAANAPPVVVLGHALWRERFGGDPAVVGREVRLDDHPFTVVGVAPRGFLGLTGGGELWVPLSAAATLYGPAGAAMLDHPQTHWLRGVGRLRPGATVAALDAWMDGVAGAVTRAHPDSDPTAVAGADAQLLGEGRMNAQARRSLLVLSAASALLLLVACANLAGLLLTRAGGRRRETAVRVALGAGRWRVARGFLAESLLLAGAGGAAAVAVAWVGADALVAAWPDRFLDGSWNVRFARLEAVRLDGAVLAYAAAVAAVSALLFGTAPALAAGREDPGRALRRGAAGAGGGRRGADARSGLVAAEIALALVLVLGAGLLLRSLERLQSVDRGFRPGRLVTFQVTVPAASRGEDGALAFHEAFLERLRALPDVESAGMGCGPPLVGHCWITGVSAADGRTWSEGSEPSIGVHPVDDTYFATLGIDVLRGRTFGPDDRAGAPRVVVLNETAVRTLFPEGEALGRRVTLGIAPPGDEAGVLTVIGVVADVLHDRPERGVMPEAYLSHRQDAPAGDVFVRTRGEPLAVVPAARATLAELDPEVPLHRVRTLDDLEAEATGDTRVLGALLSVFAGLALVLACTGVWAVVAFAVAGRTRELGLRVALGAEPRRVVALVLRKAVAVAAAGTLLGAAGGVLATRLLGGLLYGVSATDPGTFAVGAAALFSVALLAAWLPARRATRVDPMVALRAE